MDEQQRRRLASIHDRELDAAFETFEHDGWIYHPVGLMNAWVRGYTDPDRHMFTEPPAWCPQFLAWLGDRGGEVVETLVGPPAIRLPDEDVAQAFRTEWHDRARERYPYRQRAEFEREQADAGGR